MKSVLSMCVAILMLPVWAMAVNVSYNFTDGTYTAGSTSALEAVGFTYNSAITPTADMTDLNQYRNSSYYYQPTKNLLAVYNDTQWASTGVAAYLTSYDPDSSKSYPSAYYSLGGAATQGTLAMNAAVDGRGDTVYLRLKSGSTTVGWVYMHKKGAQLNGEDGYYNPALLNVISTVDTGSANIYGGYAQGIQLNWTVNSDGTGGIFTATGSYNPYSWGGNAFTKSVSAAFLADAVPDSIEIYLGYTNQVLGMKSFELSTVPEPCTVSLLGLGLFGLLRKRK